MAPITPTLRTNCRLENPLAKIAVSSFLLLSLLIENKDATRHETGKILIKNVGISKSRSIEIVRSSLVAFKSPVSTWPNDKTINRMNTEPRKNVNHSLRMSFRILNMRPYKKNKSG